MASGSAWSTLCRPRPSSRWRATRSFTASPLRAAFQPRNWRKSALPPTAAARPSPSSPMPTSSARTCGSIRRDCTSSPAPRHISLPGSRSAGNAPPNSLRPTSPKPPSSSSPAGSTTISPNSLASANALPPRPLPAARISPTRRARPNGRSPGRCGPKARSNPTIATRFPRPTAAPMRPAFAPR